MSVLVAIIVIGLIALAVWLFLTAHAHRHDAKAFQVTSRTRSDDGTLLVGIKGPSGERVVREIPPTLTGADLQRAVRLARSQAQQQADELNRASAERTRS